MRRTVRLAVMGSSTRDGWCEMDSRVNVTVGSQRSSPYERDTANMAASTSSAPSPPASSSSPIRSVRSSTRGTAGPESSVFCTISGAGRSNTGIRSIVRIRSCQGASLVSRTIGMPCAGVNAGGCCCALYPLGGTKADDSVSDPEPCPEPEAEPWPGPEAADGSLCRPAGRANSDVGWSSSGGAVGCSTPAGARTRCAPRRTGASGPRDRPVPPPLDLVPPRPPVTGALLPSMGTDMGATRNGRRTGEGAPPVVRSAGPVGPVRRCPRRPARKRKPEESRQCAPPCASRRL